MLLRDVNVSPDEDFVEHILQKRAVCETLKLLPITYGFSFR